MTDKVLVVDMDDSFLKTDLFYELIFEYIKNNFFNLFRVVFFLFTKNRLFLKNYLANKVLINIDNIPVNKSVLSWIQSNEKNYSKIILCSGSPHNLVKKVSEKYKIFDEVFGSTKDVNLNGNIKLEFLLKKGFKNFDYIGDSFKDIPLWKMAEKKICVNFSEIRSVFFSLFVKINFDKNFSQSTKEYIKSLIKLFRVNQWVKNLLILVHFMALGSFDNHLYNVIPFAFLFLCIVSSFGYVLNDLFDLDSDRTHPNKKNRPFASGELSPSSSIYIFLLLIFFGIGICIYLIPNYNLFVLAMILYLLLSSIYTLKVKHFKYLDCYVLSFFFAYRILAGSLLDLESSISANLLLFSFIIFYSLANLKRVVEIKNSLHPNVVGRPYGASDLRIIFSQGIAPILVSVIFLLSILDQLIFYKNNNVKLYLSIILFYFWILYVWYKAIISKRDFDLVTFSYKDKLSAILILIFGSLFLLHNFL
jgi:4-hydroxybenzoate polyprenyltransferase